MTSFFKTVDLIGQRYLAMLIPSLSQLWLLSYDVIKGEPPSFGALSVLHATQVIPLEGLSMMLVLGDDKKTVLYSGPHEVATVMVVSPLLSESDGMDSHSGSSVARVRDALGDSFTVVLTSGEMLRCSLPSLCRHPVGKLRDFIVNCSATV